MQGMPEINRREFDSRLISYHPQHKRDPYSSMPDGMSAKHVFILYSSTPKFLGMMGITMFFTTKGQPVSLNTFTLGQMHSALRTTNHIFGSRIIPFGCIAPPIKAE
jgi:hypothetical protein